jgi:hypothetical protein
MENVTHILIMAFSAVLFCIGLTMLFSYIYNYDEVSDAVKDSHTIEYVVSDKGDGMEKRLVVTGADVYAQYAEYRAGNLSYRIAVETAANEYSSVAGTNGRFVCPGGVKPEAEYIQQVIYNGDGDILMVIYKEK